MLPTMSSIQSATQQQLNLHVLYSGYFSEGKIFVVFVVERQTTKFLPTKQYRIVLCSHA